jgi:CHAD domain-containing protein
MKSILERELKFRVTDEEDVGGIRGVLERAGFQLEPRGALHHEDRYLDTEDWLLRRAGIQLRLRREGETVLLQAKTIATGSAEALARTEWEQPAPEEDPPWSRLPPGAIAGLLEPLTSFHVLNRLRVRATVTAEREVFRWSREDEVLGSVTLDRLPEYRELEIELDESAPDALGDARAAIEGSLGIHPSSETKLDAALGAAGVRVPVLDEARFIPQEGDTLGDAARKNLGRQLARMLWNEAGTRLGLDPEYVHDMRVATRRLRAALRVFTGALRAPTRQSWARELRWIGRALGRVRDCDVGLDHIRRMATEASEPERAALGVFANRLEIRRARRRASLIRKLDSPRFAAFRAEARPWIQMRAETRLRRGAEMPAFVVGPRIVAEWDRRMMGACAEAERRPTAARVHALRIAIKNARYAVEYFADLEGTGASRRAKRLGRLQNMLGARQDAAILLRQMKRYARTIPDEDQELLLGARAAIQKLERTARVRKSELKQVLVLGSDLGPV